MPQAKIEKLVFGGQGLAHVDGNTAFLWNALPGEEVDFEILSKRKGVIEGIVTGVLKPSKDRQKPHEKQFLSTSPWQMMDPKAELRFKQEIAAETYSKLGNLILSPEQLPIAGSERITGYRNKMEFSFTVDTGGVISLAFFERGSKVKVAVEGSVLCEDVINTTAKSILRWIREMDIPIRSLKALIVRSNGEGKAIAALFIKDKLSFPTYPSLSESCLGFELYYSTHKSPASVPTELLYHVGQNTLTATIKGAKLTFGIFSFFQINIPVFDEALSDIAAFISPKDALLDFYAGVGAIGIPISRNRSSLTIVESNEDAIHFATQNVADNGLENVTIQGLPAEHATNAITSDATLIVDPPRAGLHPNVISKILLKRPPKIIYLSCGLDTQARDLRLLSEAYRPVFFRLYNFFPRTPHIEGLVVLERV